MSSQLDHLLQRVCLGRGMLGRQSPPGTPPAHCAGLSSYQADFALQVRPRPSSFATPLALPACLHLLQLKRQEARKPTDAVARFIVTKLSWRGNYKRVLSITPSAIVTQYVDTLAVTNSWAYAGDHDLAGVEVGGEHAEGGIFTLHFRRDKKVRSGGLLGRCGSWAWGFWWSEVDMLAALPRAV